jgi:hypothetical protein
MASSNVLNDFPKAGRCVQLLKLLSKALKSKGFLVPLDLRCAYCLAIL